MLKCILLACLAFLVTPSFSQTADNYGENAEDVKILQEINEQHAKAFATANSSILKDKILADDFILISGNGNIYRKAEVLQQVESSLTEVQKIKTYQVENVKIRFVAADVAMVYARITYVMKDGTVTNGTQYNDIYAKRNGNWICVSGNNTPVAKK